MVIYTFALESGSVFELSCIIILFVSMQSVAKDVFLSLEVFF
jgi:hypothetical protein